MPRIEAFEDAHLDGALRMSQQAGWPHRHDDWALVAGLSRGVVALDGGEVVGTAFCTLQGDRARLSMIIVDARLRGRGLGRRLMARAMALAGERGMALVATVDGLPLYEKLGFVATGRIARHQGEILPVAAPRDIREGGITDLAAICTMDRHASGASRVDLLRRIAQQGRVFLADEGFALLREFGRGHVLGPIVAADATTAGALITAAAQELRGRFLRIDTPAEHGLGPLLEWIGLAHVGGGTVMRRGPASAPAEQFTTYALASQALG